MPSKRKRVEGPALDTIRGRGVFATSRSGNVLMHKVLEHHGFFRHGKTYASPRDNHELALFIRTTYQQGWSLLLRSAMPVPPPTGEYSTRGPQE